jgi:hypothetical protein
MSCFEDHHADWQRLRRLVLHISLLSMIVISSLVYDYAICFPSKLTLNLHVMLMKFDTKCSHKFLPKILVKLLLFFYGAQYDPAVVPKPPPPPRCPCRDAPNSYISFPILQLYHFTFPIISLYNLYDLWILPYYN